MTFLLNTFTKLSIIFVLILIIGVLIYIRYPLKKALNLDIKYVDKLDIKGNESRLFCINTTATGPTWGIIGTDNKILIDYKNNPQKTPIETIILTGNKNISVDINDSYGNIFIYDGKFINDKEQNGQIYRVFEVSQWNILYPVKINGLFHPDNALTPMDYFLAKKESN